MSGRARKYAGWLAGVLALALCLSLLPMAVLAADDIPAAALPIDAEHFPDEAFRGLVGDSFDTDGDGALSAAELSAATALNCFGAAVSDLSGIEYLAELTELSCFANDTLTALDVSGNAKLESISCAYCALETLDVSQNPALVRLVCSGNMLTALDVSQNTALESLDVSDNPLESLVTGDNAALKSLICARGSLSTLDVSGCPALETLDCGENMLTALDVSQNPALRWLDCRGNEIASLDLNACPALVSAASGERTETDGDVICSDGTARLAADADTALVYDVPPEGVAIDETRFPDEIFRAYVLDSFDADGDGRLSDDEAAKVRTLTLTDFGIGDLTGIECFTALEYLRCDRNALTSLDVGRNTALRELYCGDNQLETLTLGNNTALKALDCSLNRLTGLDVRGCPTLAEAVRGEKRTANGITQYGVLLGEAFIEVLTCDEGTAVTGDLSARVPGDVDGDGKADARDAALLLKLLLTDGELPDASDANGDQKIDVLDVITILRLSVGGTAIRASGSDTGGAASGTNAG